MLFCNFRTQQIRPQIASQFQIETLNFDPNSTACRSVKMSEAEARPDAVKGNNGKPKWLPKVDILFDNENDAYEFYNSYAENIGFFVRRSTLWTSSKNIVTRRTFVCSREGFREKKKGAKEVKSPRPETRIGCPACMTIRLTPNGKYKVTEFEPNHNHPLATISTINMLKAKKMRRKARAVRADLVDDSVQTPEFETEEEAYEFYCMYAAKIGFIVRRASMTMSVDNVITRRMFVCSKEGFRESKKGSKRVKKPRPETRTGCPACMIIRLTPAGKYNVSEFVTRHNHQLKIPSVDLVVNSLDNDMNHVDGPVTNIKGKKQSDKDIELPIPGSKRAKSMHIGDLGAVLQYLQKMQNENPLFFYSVQADEYNNMVNFFWADLKSILDFTYFGDSVCFDTTHKIHCCGRPLVLFVGVNHHKQPILFGSGLMYDESMASFKWLFDNFKAAMSGKQPKTILTDRSIAIGEAVVLAFPSSNHRYCVWHIYQKTIEQLSQAFHGSKTLSYDFSKCIFDCEDEEEFNLAWSGILEKYDLRDNQWLGNLFEQREKWSLAYGRESFYADLKSAQQKESLSMELKKYLSLENDILSFFEQFEKLIDERRLAELQADVLASQNTRKLPSIRILKQAASILTPSAYKMFEREFEFYMDCMLYNCGEVDNLSKYKITLDERTKDHFVTFNSLDLTATCTCKLFEFVGIQCRHVLKVLDARNIKDLPPQYVMKRWRKDAKDGAFSSHCDLHTEDDSQLSIEKRKCLLYNMFSIIASRGAKTTDSYMVVESQSELLIDQVDQISRSRAFELPSLMGTSSDHMHSQVEAAVLNGNFRFDKVNQASFVDHSSKGFLSSRSSHPTICWGQFPAGPSEQ